MTASVASTSVQQDGQHIVNECLPIRPEVFYGALVSHVRDCVEPHGHVDAAIHRIRRILGVSSFRKINGAFGAGRQNCEQTDQDNQGTNWVAPRKSPNSNIFALQTLLYDSDH
jgi:hypothetical protein